MIPSHCESAVQAVSRLPHVLATHEQVLGQDVVEQSTEAPTTTAPVATNATDFIAQATRVNPINSL
jgi:hypothetical protein